MQITQAEYEALVGAGKAWTLMSQNYTSLFDEDGIPLPGVPYEAVIEADWEYHTSNHGE